MTKCMSNNCLLTREQAAAYLNVKPQTLAAWKTRGTPPLPVVKVGRLSHYRREDLDQFIQAHTISTY